MLWYLRNERTTVKTFCGTSNPKGAIGLLLHQKMYPQSTPIMITTNKNLKSNILQIRSYKKRKKSKVNIKQSV